MKRFIYSAITMAAAAALASCSNDVLVDEPIQSQDITVTVKTTEPLSRAGVETIEGYELNCIMQLIDETGATVGTQKTMPAASGNATFVITGAEQEAGAKQALFWAEYQPTAANAFKVYNTADLTDITYNTTAFNLADEKAIAACDAFAGKLTSLTANASVSLSRPFARVSFAPSNPENAEGCNKIEVKYNTPAGYSVLTGNTAAKAAVTYTNASFDPAKTPWFVNYIFGSQSSSMLDEEITVDVTGAKTFNLTIPAGKIPTDANYLVNVSGELGDAPTQDINVSIDIDNGWANDPDKPAEMKVGSYVNAEGKVVNSASDAVAVVYALGALEDDDTDAYPAAFAGKTIKGYAVALSNIGSRLSFGEAMITGLEAAQATNGSQMTLLTNDLVKITPIGQAWAEWSAANQTSGSNVTAWYVPSLNQLSYWLGMLAPSNTGDVATGSAAFKALFPATNLFDRNPISTVTYLSSTINDQGNPSGVRLNVTGDDYNWQAAGIAISTRTNQTAIVRPMFTIFE